MTAVKDLMSVAPVAGDGFFTIPRCCELPTPRPSRRPGLAITITCDNCCTPLLYIEMESSDGQCHRTYTAGDCSLPRGHFGYCDWEGR